MNDPETDHREDGQRERQHDSPEDLRRRRAVDARRLVELLRDRVEVALHQPGVDTHRAAEVDEDQGCIRVEADHREDRADVVDDEVDRDEQERFGNIWIRSSASIPIRRPRNRKRLNA